MLDFLKFIFIDMVFDMFSGGILEIIIGILWVFALLLLVCIIIVVIYEICIAIYRDTLDYTIEPVVAKVTSKKHHPVYRTMICSGKAVIPIYHAERFDVTLEYEDIKTTLNNKDLYNGVRIGDEAQLTLRIGRNSKKEIKHKELAVSSE